MSGETAGKVYEMRSHAGVGRQTQVRERRCLLQVSKYFHGRFVIQSGPWVLPCDPLRNLVLIAVTLAQGGLGFCGGWVFFFSQNKCNSN